MRVQHILDGDDGYPTGDMNRMNKCCQSTDRDKSSEATIQQNIVLSERNILIITIAISKWMGMFTGGYGEIHSVDTQKKSHIAPINNDNQ